MTTLIGSYTPTTALAGQLLGTSASLIGKSGLTLIGAVSGLASGTSAKLYFQAPIGGVYYDIGCLAFTTGTQVKQLCCAVEGVSADNILSSLALTDDTAIQGLIGDDLKVYLVTVGTYTGGGSVSAYYKSYA